MSVVINCLEGEDIFQATFRLIGQYGRMFQLTKSNMKKNNKMGTWYEFLYNLIQCYFYRFPSFFSIILYPLTGPYQYYIPIEQFFFIVM